MATRATAGATRNPQDVTPLLERIIELDPERTLDVGAGYGQWGYLLREHLDDFVGWRAIHGVEQDRVIANRSAATHVYDTYLTIDFPGPMTGALNPHYDLVLMDGFLERVPPAHGRRALERALELAPVVLVTLPLESDWIDRLSDFGDCHDFSGDASFRCELRRR